MSDLLDSTVSKKTVRDGFANFMDRVRHFYIDAFIILVLSLTINLLVIDRSFSSSETMDKFITIAIIFVIYLLYYVLLEYFVGFTIGKFLNKTRIISLDETKPTFAQIIIRTFARLIPFGVLVVLSPYHCALHDLFSKTRLIRFKKKYVVEVNEPMQLHQDLS